MTLVGNIPDYGASIAVGRNVILGQGAYTRSSRLIGVAFTSVGCLVRAGTERARHRRHPFFDVRRDDAADSRLLPRCAAGDMALASPAAKRSTARRGRSGRECSDGRVVYGRASRLPCEAPHRRSRRCRTKPRSRMAPLDIAIRQYQGTKEPESRSVATTPGDGEQHTSRDGSAQARKLFERTMKTLARTAP